MARKPEPRQRPNLAPPENQGFVASGGMQGLAGDATWELGRLRSDIDFLKSRVSELEHDSKEIGNFHSGLKMVSKWVAGVSALLFAVLAFFFADDVKTLMTIANERQIEDAKSVGASSSIKPIEAPQAQK